MDLYEASELATDSAALRENLTRILQLSRKSAHSLQTFQIRPTIGVRYIQTRAEKPTTPREVECSESSDVRGVAATALQLHQKRPDFFEEEAWFQVDQMRMVPGWPDLARVPPEFGSRLARLRKIDNGRC